MSGRIEVVEYDNQWPIVFERLKLLIWPEVKDIALSLEHVGSTSVVGLAAKPIIDMDIVVKCRASSLSAVKAVSRLGYAHLGDRGVPGREAFKRPENLPQHNLYVCLKDSTAFRNHILLRDALRSDAKLNAEYADLKKHLAAKFPGDIDSYCEAKTAFILKALKRQGLADSELAEVAGSNIQV